MREVVTHPEQAAAKGRAARQLMLDRYSPAAVAAVIAGHLDRIKRGLTSSGELGQDRIWARN